jgi:hypothetical protein
VTAAIFFVFAIINNLAIIRRNGGDTDYVLSQVMAARPRKQASREANGELE